MYDVWVENTHTLVKSISNIKGRVCLWIMLTKYLK